MQHSIIISPEASKTLPSELNKYNVPWTWTLPNPRSTYRTPQDGTPATTGPQKDRRCTHARTHGTPPYPPIPHLSRRPIRPTPPLPSTMSLLLPNPRQRTLIRHLTTTALPALQHAPRGSRTLTTVHTRNCTTKCLSHHSSTARAGIGSRTRSGNMSTTAAAAAQSQSHRRPRRFAPLDPEKRVEGDERPVLKGIVFDVDGTLCECSLSVFLHVGAGGLRSVCMLCCTTVYMWYHS